MRSSFLVNLLALAVLSTSLSACGLLIRTDDDTDSETSDGRCKSAYINDYNDVVFDKSSYNTYLSYGSSSTLSAARELVNSCDDLKKNHSGVSCKALVDGKRKTISYRDHKGSCDSAKRYVRSYNSQASASSPQTRPRRPNQPANSRGNASQDWVVGYSDIVDFSIVEESCNEFEMCDIITSTRLSQEALTRLNDHLKQFPEGTQILNNCEVKITSFRSLYEDLLNRDLPSPRPIGLEKMIIDKALDSINENGCGLFGRN